jgi:hypothetical protein
MPVVFSFAFGEHLEHPPGVQRRIGRGQRLRELAEDVLLRPSGEVGDHRLGAEELR